METDLHLLIRYHRHGDPEAFRSLVDAHAGMVHATASRVTRDGILAQDVAQETFLALARSSGAAIQSVGAWLHHVAWQKARDVVRGEARRQNYEAAAAEYWQQTQTQTEATWAELEPALDDALNDLAVQPKAMIIARYFEGRTQQEIAKKHGISQATVSRALDQGINELRSKLKARGVLCGAGLAALLAAHAAQAAPPALVTTLGKLALTGVGAATTTLTLTQTLTTILMTPAAKISLAAAAVVVVAALGNDLAFTNSSVRRFFGGGTATPGAVSQQPETLSAPTASRTTLPPITSSRITAAFTKASTPAVTPAPASSQPRSVQAPSPAIMATISTLTKQADLKAFVLKLFASKNPQHIASELKRLIGLDLKPEFLATRLTHPNLLEVSIMSAMAVQHPEEVLAWLSLFEDSTNLMAQSVFPNILKEHPEITAESIAALLPAGPHREQILGLLRAQRDPVAEATRLMSLNADTKTRQEYLWQLASAWPKNRIAEGMQWAINNLAGDEFGTFFCEGAKQLSRTDPQQTVAFLGQITEPRLLSVALAESMSGLVSQPAQIANILPLVSKLEGQQRAWAISSLAQSWTRADQAGVMQWLNTLESPADFDSALPRSLPQLSDENYQTAITTLMTQLEPSLEAALIKTAMPNLPQSTRTSTDIIRRLTALPQYRQIGAGQSGNQNLLWQAVLQNAEGWVSQQGANPQDGARWIDSLPFKTPADKATAAAKIHAQWKLSDPVAAAQWAAGAGVVLK